MENIRQLHGFPNLRNRYTTPAEYCTIGVCSIIKIPYSYSNYVISRDTYYNYNIKCVQVDNRKVCEICLGGKEGNIVDFV